VDTNQQDYPVVTMEEDAKKKPKPRGQRVTDEFKASAIAMVLDEGKSPESVAKDLGLSRSTFFRWVRQARIDRGEGARGELTSDERRRLLVLERENRQLKTERELLKKWVAFSAKEMSK
jgi:transposase